MWSEHATLAGRGPIAFALRARNTRLAHHVVSLLFWNIYLHMTTTTTTRQIVCAYIIAFDYIYSIRSLKVCPCGRCACACMADLNASMFFSIYVCVCVSVYVWGRASAVDVAVRTTKLVSFMAVCSFRIARNCARVCVCFCVCSGVYVICNRPPVA